MTINYSLVQDGDQIAVTAISNGRVLLADNTHPNFAKIVSALLLDEPDVESLFDVAASVKETFESLSERVSISNGRVFFDGDEIDNSVSQAVLRFVENDLDVKPLVLFMENLASNPSDHSREQLYSWLSDRNFSLCADGTFIAYKGVAKHDDGYYSIHAGSAMVNGERQNGRIKQQEGDVVTMPRSNVAFDPQVGCSYGLHAGTWDYAESFAQGAVLYVKINPRDVVSVPTDCNAQKLRVCRYVVVKAADVEYTEPLFDDDTVVEYDSKASFGSSVLESAWYSSSDNVLTVFLRDSDYVYQYDVDSETWDSLLSSESPGKFYNDEIKPLGAFERILKSDVDMREV